VEAAWGFEPENNGFAGHFRAFTPFYCIFKKKTENLYKQTFSAYLFYLNLRQNTCIFEPKG
jgi:hypothetical protein